MKKREDLLEELGFYVRQFNALAEKVFRSMALDLNDIRRLGDEARGLGNGGWVEGLPPHQEPGWYWLYGPDGVDVGTVVDRNPGQIWTSSNGWYTLEEGDPGFEFAEEQIRFHIPLQAPNPPPGFGKGEDD